MKKKELVAVVIIFFLELFFSGRSSSGQALSPSSQEMLNQEISFLFQRPTQKAYRALESTTGPSVRKCSTPLLHRALLHKELLEAENRFILHRPTDSYDEDYYGNGVEIWRYETEGGHFFIYYTEDSSPSNNHVVRDADGNKATLPLYVEKFTEYFEQAWDRIINKLGYLPPAYPVEVFILSINAYGITSSDNNGEYIMVDKDYRWVRDNLDQDSSELGAMKVTAAHEFFHVVQAVYNHWPEDRNNVNMWWEENTAVWIEDEVFDEVDDYLNYLGMPYQDKNDNGKWDSSEIYYDIWGNSRSDERDDGWFDYPEISLDKTSDDWDCSYYYYEYGGVIWAKFLAESFGQDMIKSIYKNFPLPPYTNDHIGLKVIDETLAEYGRVFPSLTEAFIQFKLANLMADYKEEEEMAKDLYPLPFHYRSRQAPYNHEQDDLNYLSCKYLAFHKPVSGNRLRILFNGDGRAQLVVMAVPASSYNSSPHFGSIQQIDLDEEQVGVFDFSFQQNPSYNKLIVIPINLSWTTKTKGVYSLSAQELNEDLCPPVPQIIDIISYALDNYPVVRVSWQKIEGVHSYQIWRGKVGYYLSKIFDSENSNTLVFLDANSYEDMDIALESGQSYLYQIKFLNSFSCSSSELKEIKIPETYLHNIRARYSNTKRPYAIIVSFTIAQNEVSFYQIERKIRGSTDLPIEVQSMSPVDPNSPNVIFKDEDEVLEDIGYTYIVTVYNEEGEEILQREISVELSVSTPLPSKSGGGGCFLTLISF